MSRLAYRFLRAVLPKRVRQRLVSVTRYPQTFRVVADLRSFRLFRRLENSTKRWRDDQLLVPIRVRALGGQTVLLRPGTTDTLTAIATFAEVHHLPPHPLDPGSVPRVWDLGSNIGLTVADLACRYPSAEIVGVELDDGNARLARRNVSPWSSRCEIVEAAVWSDDGAIQYRRDAGNEEGFRVAPVLVDAAPNATAPALSLNRLLEMGEVTPIDYVKMDIEGAEREVLRDNTQWASSVRSIKVEIHSPYTVEECQRDLRRLGFATTVDVRHPALVAGVRSES